MIRKKLSVLLLAIALSGLASAIQPGCKTRYEMRTKWTVQDNNSRYWQCSRWGFAEQKSCPPGTLFTQPYQTCVPVRIWEELPYYPPPSAAHENVDECAAVPVTCDTCVEVSCEGGIVIDRECVCKKEGWATVGGVCRNPEVVCIDGDIYDDRCNCAQGFELIDGKCTDPSEPVICVLGVTDPCLCPVGLRANSRGICVDDVSSCEGGEWVDGRCFCLGDSVLTNGVCVTPTSEIEGCVNGQWNAVENYCVCNEGYEMVEGQCVTRGSVGICDGAPESAYQVRGTWNCDVPVCTEDEYQRNIHLPTRNPRTFWQCELATPIEMPCRAGTCFSPDRQTCVHAVEWVNPCM